MQGGYGTGRHGTMAERVAATQRQGHAEPPTEPPAESPADPPEAPGPAVPASPARHCHVAGEPSLLVEWRRTARGWEGRVLTLVWMDAVGWVTLERWLPAADIWPG